jgi:hypothetical protein
MRFWLIIEVGLVLLVLLVSSPDRHGPFGWDDLLVDLGWGWAFREED